MGVGRSPRSPWVRSRCGRSLCRARYASFHQLPCSFMTLPLEATKNPYLLLCLLVCACVCVFVCGLQQVWFREGIHHQNPEGSAWVEVQCPGEVVQINCGPGDLVWAVMWEGHLLVREGIGRDCLKGQSLQTPNTRVLHSCPKKLPYPLTSGSKARFFATLSMSMSSYRD